jgi:stage II sporulation protein AA (anti-sigma F factor antagonist)
LQKGDTKNGEEKTMEIHLKKEREVTVVSVKGRMDAVTAPEFEKPLSDLIIKAENTLILNFGDLASK